MGIHIRIERGNYPPEVLAKLGDLVALFDSTPDRGRELFEKWLLSSKGDPLVTPLSGWETFYFDDTGWFGDSEADNKANLAAMQERFQEVVSALPGLPDDYDTYEDWPPYHKRFRGVQGRLSCRRRTDDVTVIDVWPVEDISF